MPQRAATIESLPEAFALVKEMRADGLEWGEGYRPLGREALAAIIEYLDRFYLPADARETFGWWVLGTCLGLALLGEALEFLAGAAGAANGRERAGVQAQGVADIIETEGVGELGEDQAHDMTPRCEGAGLFLDAGVAGQLGHQVRRNKVAELAQERELAARWRAVFGCFHPRPCGRVQTRKPTLFLPHQTIKAEGHL